MFDAIHDLYVGDYLNDVNARVKYKSMKSRSAKSKKKKMWKPTDGASCSIEVDTCKPVVSAGLRATAMGTRETTLGRGLKNTSNIDSNDEEYAMAVRDFKRFFRRRGKFVRQPYDDKKNLRKEKEDKKEKEDRRCFKCGDPNHFISDCPKRSFGDQKAFVVGC
nr:zf-CCHC domain-containing protein [Tanacetum cinerariifolium]